MRTIDLSKCTLVDVSVGTNADGDTEIVATYQRHPSDALGYAPHYTTEGGSLTVDVVPLDQPLTIVDGRLVPLDRQPPPKPMPPPVPTPVVEPVPDDDDDELDDDDEGDA